MCASAMISDHQTNRISSLLDIQPTVTNKKTNYRRLEKQESILQKKSKYSFTSMRLFMQDQEPIHSFKEHKKNASPYVKLPLQTKIITCTFTNLRKDAKS